MTIDIKQQSANAGSRAGEVKVRASVEGDRVIYRIAIFDRIQSPLNYSESGDETSQVRLAAYFATMWPKLKKILTERGMDLERANRIREEVVNDMLTAEQRQKLFP